jgi:PKD repeat protein
VYDGECAGQLSNFYSLSKNVDSVHWDFGDPASGSDNFSTLLEPKHTYNTVGTYLVRITIYVAGESESYSEEIDIKASPILNLRDSTICNSGSYTVMIPYPEASVLWDDANTEHNRTIDVDGRYSVSVNLNGCSVSDDLSLAFYDTPIEDYELVKACIDERVLLEVKTEKSNYLWNDGLEDKHTYVFSDGIYSAEVENPCGIDTAVFELVFNNCECNAYVPNAISLNGDGLNEAFKATLSCELDLEYYSLRVYSLWGEKVFEAHSRDEVFIPSEFQSDVFIWTLEFGTKEYNNNVAKTYSGVLHILR